MGKKLLPIALAIVLLFSSVAFAGGQGVGKESPSKGEPKVEAQLGANFEGEKVPVYPGEREEWRTFTYCYGDGYGYGYGYAYDRLNTCTDGSCICTDGCCEYFIQHQWRWMCELPDLTDPPELPDDPAVTEP
jgi:hypothetical protein